MPRQAVRPRHPRPPVDPSPPRSRLAVAVADPPPGRGRRPRSYLAAASVAAGMLLVGPTAPAAWGAPAAGAARAAGTVPVPPAASTAGAAAAGWLATAITAGGGTLPGPGGPDANATAEGVLALQAAGVGAAAAAQATGWLEQHVDAYVGSATGPSGPVDSPAALATLILLAHTRGLDPHTFGTPAVDLPARLLATQRATGADAGLFGAAAPDYDGAFRQGLALLALHAVGRSSPAGTAWLLGQQCADGGWQAYRASTAAPCATADPNLFTGPDTNSTALAVLGLAADGASLTHEPLAFLRAAQAADGGWPYIGTAGQAAGDPNSTGLVLQALLARGVDPAGVATGGRSGWDGLLRWQLGCDAPAAARGALWFDVGDGTRTPNALATAQAVPALVGLTLAVPPATPGPSVPVQSCPTPSPTPTPSPSGPPSGPGTPTPAAPGSPPPGSTLPGQVPAAAGALSGIPAVVAPGARLSLTGGGFAPGSSVIAGVYSAPTVLGSGAASTTGVATVAVTVPTGLAGTHTLVLLGTDPAGQPRALTATVTVGELPATGAGPAPGRLGTALALVAVGAVAVAVSRRRPDRSAPGGMP